MNRIKPWTIEREGPVSEETESIFSVGNGVMGIRGFSLQTPKYRPHDHATFHAGLYEEIRPGITDLVQLPDVFGIRIDGVEEGHVHHILNLQTGVYTQKWMADGLTVETSRMASMADTQCICVRLKVRSDADRTIHVTDVWEDKAANLPVNDDQMIEQTQCVCLLETVLKTPDEMLLKTIHGAHTIRIVKTVSGMGKVTLKAGETCTAEKQIRILMDEEKPNNAGADPWLANESAWAALWRDCDIQMDTQPEIQGAVRYNVFELLASNSAQDRHVSIGARGLTHGRYKGNTFWDTDVFLLPFFCWQRPRAARNLVLYRCDRLDDARELAKSQSLCGARYPWMCAESGKEQCESWDIGCCETHITADVAYAMSRYEEITADESLNQRIAEVYLETARYWKSRFTWEEKHNQFSSFFVKGPDEYCGATVNNMFTNWLARYNVRLALKHASMTQDERDEMSFFEKHIAILYDEKRKLYLQDELFERLEPLQEKKEKGHPLYRSLSFDKLQRIRALKQADLVQLMVMLPQDFSEEQKQAVWSTYEPLTLHDSSLSYGVHALLAFELGEMDSAWQYFEKSLLMDLSDIMDHHGREGLHVAAMGISWQAIVYGMLGLWSENGKMQFSPHLPENIRHISLCLYHRGERYRVEADHQAVTVKKEA